MGLIFVAISFVFVEVRTKTFKKINFRGAYRMDGPKFWTSVIGEFTVIVYSLSLSIFYRVYSLSLSIFQWFVIAVKKECRKILNKPLSTFLMKAVWLANEDCSR